MPKIIIRQCDGHLVLDIDGRIVRVASIDGTLSPDLAKMLEGRVVEIAESAKEWVNSPCYEKCARW